MPVIRYVLLTYLLVVSPVAMAGEAVGRASVIDGDTLDIGEQRIRLAGIDAPETTQRGGDEAKLLLEAMTSKNEIRCVWEQAGVYGRALGTCYAMTRSGAWSKKSINSRMVRAGLAWAYPARPYDYALEMMMAMGTCAGIWKDSEQPGCWRKTR